MDNTEIEQLTEPTIMEQPVETTTMDQPINDPLPKPVLEREIPAVIQNSDVLYKSGIKWNENIEYEQPNSFEIEMLSGTKKPDQLIAEEQNEVIVLKSEEELKVQKQKDLMIIFKVVSLDRMKLHPLKDTSTLQPDPRKEFLSIMNSLIDDYSNNMEEQICAEFNKICVSKLFKFNTDYSTFPVYA